MTQTEHTSNFLFRKTIVFIRAAYRRLRKIKRGMFRASEIWCQGQGQSSITDETIMMKVYVTNCKKSTVFLTVPDRFKLIKK